MLVETDGLPRIGFRSKCLGVRPPPDPNADIDLDTAGNVLLNRKVLSVSANWRGLPGHLIPEHFDDGFNGASGKRMRVFVHGAGAFHEGAVATGLDLLFKTGTNAAGVVAPVATVPLTQYQSHLATTRANWVVDES